MKRNRPTAANGADRAIVRAGSPIPFDDIDKAIIRELQVDGRIPYAKLGPLVGLSQAAVRQRVQRLTDSGAVQIVAVTDPIAVGFSLEALIAVSVEGDLRSVADALAEIEHATYVVITTGRFDIMCEVVCEDTDELLTLLNDVIRRIPGVTHAETFTYMHLTKQSYSWGTR